MSIFIENYMTGLRKNLLQGQQATESPKPLIQEIREWFSRLPEGDRDLTYHMDFFIYRFGQAPARIGPALFELGWTRRRSWTTGKPHSRVWVPPGRN